MVIIQMTEQIAKPEKLELKTLEYNESINYVETKILYLSTRNSSGQVLNGDAKSWVRYNLRSYLNFEDDPNVQYVSISIPYATMVNSNYIVNSYNNVLYYSLSINYAVVYSLTIPPGNYDVNSMMNFLKSTYSFVENGFNLSFNNTTLKYTFTNSNYDFRLLGQSTCDYILGFNDTVQSDDGTAICPRICNFLPTPSFQITTVGGTMYNGLILAPDGQVQIANVLACIPNIGKVNSQLVYRNDGQEFRLSTLSQNFLEIQILDNENRLVDFNGITTFFTLKINVYRKQSTIKGKFTDILERAIITRTNAEIDNQV